MVEPGDGSGQWLVAARAGSEAALGNALQACRNYLLLIAGQELDSDLQARGGASDLVQETFLEAKRDFAHFQGTSDAELMAWLRQILVNNVANFTRRHHAAKREVKREVVLETGDSAQAGSPALLDPMRTPSSQVVVREQSAALHRALARLADDYRQVLVLRYMEGRSFEEIGPLMNRSPDAARKLWSRAMERLRQEWEGP
jgi:RNA polymerase sigma-70 factor (ECF subfamily)